MEMVRQGMLIAAMVFALMGVMVSARSAKAAQPPDVIPSWATWEFDLVPSGSNLEATWYVTVGGEDKFGNSTPMHTEAIPLNCRLIDDVEVNNDMIVFGGGYVECDFPGLIQTANEIIVGLWGQQYTLSVGPDCNCMPIYDGYATVVAAPGKGQILDDLPVFSHPSISFGLAALGGQIATDFAFSNDSSQSKRMAPQKATYESRYQCDPTNGTCFFHHYRDSNPISSDKVHYQTSTFLTGPVTVMIGRDSAAGTTYSGAMGRLNVDPGCRAH